jgi:hypothetical protein
MGTTEQGWWLVPLAAGLPLTRQDTDMLTVRSRGMVASLMFSCTECEVSVGDDSCMTITLSEGIAWAIDHINASHRDRLESRSVFLDHEPAGHPRPSVLPLPAQPEPGK